MLSRIFTMIVIFAAVAQGATVRELRPAIDRAAANHSVNPYMLEAIMRHESANGTSRAAKKLNNYSGIMKSGRLKKFNQPEDCVFYTAELLANYAKNGRFTPESIGKRYAPRNPKWAFKVKKHIKQIEQERLGLAKQP